MIIQRVNDAVLSTSFSSLHSAMPTLVAIASGPTAMNHSTPHPKIPGLPDKDDPEAWSSLIGVITAICGNVLISIALNTQRYAHIRLQEQWEQKRRLLRTANRRTMRDGDGNINGRKAAKKEQKTRQRSLNGDGTMNGSSADTDDVDELAPLLGRRTPNEDDQSGDEGYNNLKEVSQKSYLKSSLWWTGIVLMTVGEAGNFLAYGFAPASIVSPLGVVAIISNCIIGPFFMKEHFRFRDFLGVLVAVAGAVTVVLSASENNPKLGPHEIWDLITRWEFETYLGVSSIVIIILMLVSDRYGQKSIFIDIGLVGLFGGYTALSTKGVASLLSYTLFQALTFPVTYLLVAVLVFTAVMQIKYVNRALQRFEATQVIPTQFVLFTLSVILGSAVLYRDFEKTPGEDAGKFVGGCAMTFIGVWLITSARSSPDDDEDSYIDEDEEAIVLRPGEQYPNESNVAVVGSHGSLPSILGFSEDESELAGQTTGTVIRRHGDVSKISLPESLERNNWERTNTNTTASSVEATPDSRRESRAGENAPPGIDPDSIDGNPWTESTDRPVGLGLDADLTNRPLRSQPSSIQRLIATFFPDHSDKNTLPTTLQRAARYSAPDIPSAMDSSLSPSTTPSTAAQTPRVRPTTRQAQNALGTSLPDNAHDSLQSVQHAQQTNLLLTHHHTPSSTLYPGTFPSPLSSSLSAMVTNSIRRSRAAGGGGSISGESRRRRRRSARPGLATASTEAVAGTNESLLDSGRRNTLGSERSGTTTTASNIGDDDDYTSFANSTQESLLTVTPARANVAADGDSPTPLRRTPLRLGNRLGSLFSRARARIASSDRRDGGDGQEQPPGDNAV